MYNRKVLLLICIMAGVYFSPAYAQGSRKDAISCLLDYHTFKREAEEKKQEEQKTQEAKMVEVEARQKKRLDKVKDFLDNFHFYTEAKVTFNDNIYLTGAETVSDIITEVTPGIKYVVSSDEKRLKILLDGGVRFKSYVQKSQRDTENPYGNLSLTYGLGRLSFGLSHSFEKGQEEISQIITGSQEDLLVDYRRHTSTAKLNLDLSRSAWDLWYTHPTEVYDCKEVQLIRDFEEDFIGIAGSWKMFPKTSLFLEYNRRWRDYAKEGKLDREHSVYWLGVRGDISAKLKGVAKAGYEKGDYGDGSAKDDVTISLNLTYRASPRLEYDLTVIRSIGDSGLRDEVSDRMQKYTLLCRYQPPFNKRLRLSAGIAYEFKEYGSGREDDAYSLKFLSEYELRKWLRLFGEYQFNEVVSTARAAEYDNNVLSLGLRCEF